MRLRAGAAGLCLLLLAACPGGGPVEPDCGTSQVGDSQVQRYCGDAIVHLRLDGTEHELRDGECRAEPEFMTVAAGTAATGDPELQAGFDMFILQVGVPSSGDLAAPDDGTYETLAATFAVGGTTYTVTPGPEGGAGVSVTLSEGRTRGEFSGPAVSGGDTPELKRVTGTFDCTP